MKRLIFVAVAVIALAGCKRSELDNGGANGEPTISFKATFESESDGVTSSQNTKATETAFENGDIVGVYLTKHDLPLRGSFNAMDNRLFEYFAAGDSLGGVPNSVFYPDKKTPVAVYAYYPFAPNVDNALALPFRVTTDLKASDLCHAKLPSAAPSPTPQPLQFVHSLSKLTVKVDFTKNDRVESLISTTLLGIIDSCYLNLATNAVTNGTHTADMEGSTFILPPQAMHAGKLFRITCQMKDGQIEEFYYEPTTSPLTLQQSKKHEITLVLMGSGGVSLSDNQQIADWTGATHSEEIFEGVVNNVLTLPWIHPSDRYKLATSVTLHIRDSRTSQVTPYTIGSIALKQGHDATMATFEITLSNLPDLSYPFIIEKVIFNGATNTPIARVEQMKANIIYRSGNITIGHEIPPMELVNIAGTEWCTSNLSGPAGQSTNVWTAFYPDDCGKLFKWGDSWVYERVSSTTDGQWTSATSGASTAPSASYTTGLSYDYGYGLGGGRVSGDPCKILGAEFQTPSRAQFQTLIESGKSAWTTYQGVAGRFFGPNAAACNNTTIAPGCIFLAAVGHRNSSTGGMQNDGMQGSYWSASSTHGSAQAYIMDFFTTETLSPNGGCARGYAFPVRCVKTPPAVPSTVTIAGVEWCSTNLTGAVGQGGQVKLLPYPQDWGAFFKWGDTWLYDCISSSSDGLWTTATSGASTAPALSYTTELSYDYNYGLAGGRTSGDPCQKLGADYRTPTRSQYQKLVASGKSALTTYRGISGYFFGPKAAQCNNTTMQADCLFLPAAGYRAYNDGSLNNRGVGSHYWSSSTSNSTNGYNLHFDIGGSATADDSNCRGYGCTVRCVKMSPLPPATVTIGGVKWCSTNLTGPAGQATEFKTLPYPQDSGPFFKWGDTWIYDRRSSSTDGMPGSDIGNASIYPASTFTDYKGYDYGYGLAGGRASGDPCMLLGANYRTPTTAQFQALVGAGVSAWTTYNGVNGYFLGPNAATCTNTTLQAGCIFIPAAGERDYTNGSLYYEGADGHYWSSSALWPGMGEMGSILGFDKDKIEYAAMSRRGSGYSVRCIYDDAPGELPALNVTLSTPSQIVATTATSATFTVTASPNPLGVTHYTIIKDGNATSVSPSGVQDIATSGAHSQVVTVNFPINGTGSARTIVVTIKHGTTNLTHTITQGATTITGSDPAAIAQPNGSATTLNFIVTSGLGWTISGTPAWFTPSATSGTGTGANQSVTLTAGENATGAVRTGALTITAGSVVKVFTVTQNASTITISNTTASTIAATSKGVQFFTVTVGSGTPWTVTNNSGGWLTNPANGTGNGAAQGFAFNVAANNTAAARSAVVTVTAGGKTVTCTVTQAVCALYLSATTQTVAPHITTAIFNVTSDITQYGVQYTPVMGANATAISPNTTQTCPDGRFSGGMKVDFAANTGNQRSVIAYIKYGTSLSMTHTITQQAASLTFGSTASVDASSSGVRTTLISNVPYTSTYSAGGSSSQGVGNNPPYNTEITFNYPAQPNVACNARTHTMTVTPNPNNASNSQIRTLTITQAGRDASLDLSDTGPVPAIPRAGRTYYVNVISNSPWGVTDVENLSVNPSSGNGNVNNVAITVPASTLATTRRAYVRFLTTFSGFVSWQTWSGTQEIGTPPSPGANTVTIAGTEWLQCNLEGTLDNGSGHKLVAQPFHGGSFFKWGDVWAYGRITSSTDGDWTTSGAGASTFPIYTYTASKGYDYVQGLSGGRVSGDPCQKLGPQYRTPTETQFTALRDGNLDGTSDCHLATYFNVKGYFFGNHASDCTNTAIMPDCIFLPMVGARNFNGGVWYGDGTIGEYWAAGVHSPTYGRNMALKESEANPHDYFSRGHGFSVRCVKDASAVPVPPLVTIAGIKWCTTNLTGPPGSNTGHQLAQTPQESGNFFKWGDSWMYYRRSSSTDGEWTTATSGASVNPTATNTSNLGYDYAQGLSGGRASGDPCRKLGAAYRTPTRGEFLALNSLGSFWGDYQGVYGRFFGPNASTSNNNAIATGCIFFPACGYRLDDDGSLCFDVREGAYWSSSVNSINYGYCLNFSNTSATANKGFPRGQGLSVRCIQE